MNEVTITRLKAMRLPTMAEKLHDMLATPRLQGLAWPDAVELLVDAEHEARGNKRLTAMLKKARLKYPAACLEDVAYGEPRGITKDMARPFRDGTYIKEAHNVLIAGPTGTGKSYLACALANHACRTGVRTQYSRMNAFLDELEAARAMGTLQKAMERLRKVRLLVLDDLGADPLPKEHRKLLFEVVEDFYASRSIIITSQVPVKQWGEVFGEPTMAEAICDRLFHYCHRIGLKGESMRKRKP